MVVINLVAQKMHPILFTDTVKISTKPLYTDLSKTPLKPAVDTSDAPLHVSTQPRGLRKGLLDEGFHQWLHAVHKLNRFHLKCED